VPTSPRTRLENLKIHYPKVRLVWTLPKWKYVEYLTVQNQCDPVMLAPCLALLQLVLFVCPVQEPEAGLD